MNNLPYNWSWVKLGDIGEVVAGGTPSTKVPEYFDGKIAWITPADLTGYTIKYISRGRRNISDAGLKNSSARIVPKGSILFSSRAPIGYVAIASNELCTNQGFKNLIPNKKIDSEFVYYYLKSAKQLAEKNASGTTFKEISAKNFANLHFPLPPLPEQKKIVDKIDELFSGLDSGVASLKKAKEQIRLYRQSVLSAAFSGRLVKDEKRETKEEFETHLNGVQGVTEQELLEHLPYKQVVPKAAEPKVGYGKDLPEGWKWVKLGVVTQLNPKLPFEEIDENIIVSFLPMRQVEELTGKFDLSMEKKYSEVKKGFTPFTNGDVIFAKITPCMENGKIAVVNKLKNQVGFGSTEFHVFRVKADLVNQYLFYFLIQDTFRAKAQHNMTGAVGQKRVPKRFLEESEIPLPPKDQQHQIVSEIEKRFSEADNLEKAIDESLTKSETLRQSILKQAFSGKLIMNN